MTLYVRQTLQCIVSSFRQLGLKLSKVLNYYVTIYLSNITLANAVSFRWFNCTLLYKPLWDKAGFLMSNIILSNSGKENHNLNE